MAVVCIPTNLVESIILRHARARAAGHAKLRVPARFLHADFIKLPCHEGGREKKNVSIYRSLFPARLFKRGGQGTELPHAGFRVSLKCRCTRSTLRSSSFFFLRDFILSRWTTTIPFDIWTLACVIKRTCVIIIFHLFERTRCDPLSVGIKSKNGGEQSGVDISLFRVYFERVNESSGRL